MKKLKWFSLFFSFIYVASIFGNWKGVDASVDLMRGIDITGMFPVFIIGLTLVLIGFFKQEAYIASIIGALILIIGEVAYLLNWEHIFSGFNLSYSIEHMHTCAIISLVCATSLLVIAIIHQRFNKAE